MTLPYDYTERVYAGVLGKIIGVYLGRPFEGWLYKDIMAKLGEINYYVHEQLKKPLVVTDDDISGTFLFFRALVDSGAGKKLTAKQIGHTWLNYIIEKKTVLWWGGVGTSTEHTAFLRLKQGMAAPATGSMKYNGQVVAEQIGAQIFIDAWGMVAPGDPKLAADFAAKAGAVSHDGEAIYGAQVIAAIEAQAFVEQDLNKLLDTGLSVIPKNCVIARLIKDIRNWRSKDNDWRKTFARIQKSYGYDSFGGGCHMVPNHALIILALVYGDCDFQKSLMIANTAGWDTDCNSANVGCILGIRNGLAGIDGGPDWRGPVADRLYLPSAKGGDCITDAVRETYTVVNAARNLNGLEPLAPKNGARFHFELPGSVQGFGLDQAPECKGIGRLANLAGQSRLGTRSLAIDFEQLAHGRAVRAATPTFITLEESQRQGYGLIASPTLYPTQTVVAEISAPTNNPGPVNLCLFVRCFGPEDALITCRGPVRPLKPGARETLAWKLPNTVMAPVCEVGVELTSDTGITGRVALDSLTWDGTPSLDFKQPEWKGGMWKQAWVQATDHSRDGWRHLTQDEGVGMVSTGTDQWNNYKVTASVQPHLAKTAGVVACYQGLGRYYALLLSSDNTVRIEKACEGRHTLAKKSFAWKMDDKFKLELSVQNGSERAVLEGRVNGKLVLKVEDKHAPFQGGGIAMLIEEG
ncbi:MAG TPA: ADP-ribosylglycohydrolase family protein, partial [Planctomycetota bacterium]|nr:ADP-ribosylglycohydrolase family protein [Planctomycetota bacterium]